MLISIHMPKTAGKSFAASLRDHYGERFRYDYVCPDQLPPLRRRAGAVSACLRNAARPPDGLECVHGHFLALRYAGVGLRRPTTFVTWLRDPVERLASHYHHWHRTYERGRVLPLHTRCIQEEWSLERFCLGPELRNLYSEFLWGFPFGRLAFVGISEHFDEDFRHFSERFLGVELPTRRKNVAPEKRERWIEDPELRRRIEEHHARDVALYRRALARREARIASGEGTAP